MISGTWHICAQAGDEWLITYALSPNLGAVTLFAVGHAVELYLKAVNLKCDGKTRLSHEIKDLWDDCKRRDAAFMPSYEIRQSALDAPLFSGRNEFEFLNAADCESFFSNMGLYLVAKLLPDLKYAGLEMQRHSGPFARGSVYPDPYWIKFFSGLRAYLQYPAPEYRDPIAQHLRSGDVPARAREYLRGLYAAK